jgi:hypothetical protein
MESNALMDGKQMDHQIAVITIGQIEELKSPRQLMRHHATREKDTAVQTVDTAVSAMRFRGVLQPMTTLGLVIAGASPMVKSSTVRFNTR